MVSFSPNSISLNLGVLSFIDIYSFSLANVFSSWCYFLCYYSLELAIIKFDCHSFYTFLTTNLAVDANVRGQLTIFLACHIRYCMFIIKLILFPLLLSIQLPATNIGPFVFLALYLLLVFSLIVPPHPQYVFTLYKWPAVSKRKVAFLIYFLSPLSRRVPSVLINCPFSFSCFSLRVLSRFRDSLCCHYYLWVYPKACSINIGSIFYEKLAFDSNDFTI